MDCTLAENILAEGFSVFGKVVSVEPLKNGKINGTFLVRSENAEYVLQSMNPVVFNRPYDVMDNVRQVLRYLRESGCPLRVPHLYQGKENGIFCSQNRMWRLFDFIPGVSFPASEEEKVLNGAGEAYGCLLRYLQKYDGRELKVTFPGLRDAPLHYSELRDALRTNPEKAAALDDKAGFLFACEEKACRMADCIRSGAIPARITHNDTKLANVLFDRETGKPVGVIDFDTVMPGYLPYEFGDAVRSVAIRKEGGKPVFSENAFSAFSVSFLSQLEGILTDTEKECLTEAAFILTAELAIRYYTDYLTGTGYFREEYPGQNRDRGDYCVSCARVFMDKETWMRDEIVRALPKG